jgi:hypothetical protein
MDVKIDTIANAPNVDCETIVGIFAIMIFIFNRDNSVSYPVGRVLNHSDNGSAVNIEWCGHTELVFEKIQPDILNSLSTSFFTYLSQHFNEEPEV